ncbi:MAG TPA: DUF805 domain-containing protein [Caulobacteraceae bacterium]|nr:DUF805 domain-containing protein [Caulobacteraceae bacterium]
MQLFFTSAGRIGRGAFLAAMAGLVAVFAAYERMASGPVHRGTAWIVHLVLFFCAVSVLSKRLHDRGRSGWWSAPAMLAFALAWPMPRGPAGWAAAAVLIAAAVDLGAMPGQDRFNRFGAPPSR